jgi:hypothetical protein
MNATDTNQKKNIKRRTRPSTSNDSNLLTMPNREADVVQNDWTILVREFKLSEFQIPGSELHGRIAGSDVMLPFLLDLAEILQSLHCIHFRLKFTISIHQKTQENRQT